ncbi:MAG: SUMF1/EgtB/PvdO family nonheme iron enzyme [Myxococcales bacterium]|nr:SUMF1/EgtB/PvdO family nonheme iron enzyme [Myxococcales bacterium]
MVTVGKSTGGAYCVDDTEVTNGDYDRFLQANVPASGPSSTQPIACAANTTYVPSANWPPPQPLSGSFGNPVRNVDWCDAVAYCRWAGKSLCGDLAGQPIAAADANEYTRDAWVNACTNQGANVFPYGAAYVPGQCYNSSLGKVSDWTDQGTYVGIPLTNPPQARSCQGGVTNLFQMSGNLAEWENSCDAAADTCLVRGGSYLSTAPATNLACKFPTGTPPAVGRLIKRDDIGFRCCQY